MVAQESTLQEWRETESLESTDEKDMESAPLSDVIRVVNDILGYDLIHAQLMAEGYIATRDEDHELAEGDMAAGFETLPPE